MEAAEEARLQRDATLAAHDALAADNAALSARLVDALQLQVAGAVLPCIATGACAWLSHWGMPLG